MGFMWASCSRSLLADSCIGFLSAAGDPPAAWWFYKGYYTPDSGKKLQGMQPMRISFPRRGQFFRCSHRRTQKNTQSNHALRVEGKMVPPTGIEPVRFLGRGILSAKTHSERGGIRLHQNESISYASSGVFPIFQSFSLKKFSYSPVFRTSFRIAWSINLTRFSSLWRDVWRDADRARPERRRLNEKQKVL